MSTQPTTQPVLVAKQPKKKQAAPKEGGWKAFLPYAVPATLAVIVIAIAISRAHNQGMSALSIDTLANALIMLAVTTGPSICGHELMNRRAQVAPIAKEAAELRRELRNKQKTYDKAFKQIVKLDNEREAWGNTQTSC